METEVEEKFSRDLKAAIHLELIPFLFRHESDRRHKSKRDTKTPLRHLLTPKYANSILLKGFTKRKSLRTETDY